MAQGKQSEGLNESFVFNSIRKYNKATRRTQKDAVLHAVGVHVKILKKKRSPLVELSSEERSSVLYFLRQFCEQQGVSVLLKD
jgi:hypothetical protein